MPAARRLELSLPRRALATAGALAGAVIMRSWGDFLPWSLWIPAGLLALSALLVHRNHIGGQLLARAILWSNLLLGALIAGSSNGSEQMLGAGLAVATGGALLAVGRAGLGATAAGAFSPGAFRGAMIATLVLATADAQSFLLFGGIGLEEHHEDKAAPLLLAGGVLLVAVAGLYRLRVWGVLLAALASAAVAACGVAGAFDLPPPLLGMIVASAVLQLALPAPIFAALARAARGRAPGIAPGTEGVARRGLAISSAVVAAMMALSAICALSGWRPIPL
jgi:hypothetical protein